jgi:hypothetical protein
MKGIVASTDPTTTQISCRSLIAIATLVQQRGEPCRIPRIAGN